MNRRPTLTQLRYFCAVARAGSMTAAAIDLVVAQSTLSASITQLEDVLGIRLFDRLPRRTLALTAAGTRVLDEALRILDDVDGLGTIARDGTKGVSGELVVGIFSATTSFQLPPILAAMTDTYPEVSIRFLEGNLEETRQALRAGRCDVALTYSVGLGDGFDYTEVERNPAHVIVPAGHRLSQRTGGVGLAELVDEPLVLLDRPTRGTTTSVCMSNSVLFLGSDSALPVTKPSAHSSPADTDTRFSIRRCRAGRHTPDWKYDAFRFATTQISLPSASWWPIGKDCVPAVKRACWSRSASQWGGAHPPRTDRFHRWSVRKVSLDTRRRMTNTG